MHELEIQLQIHPHFEGLEVPQYQTAGSSGLDLVAASGDPIIIPPGGRELVPTGLSVAIPEGYELQIRPRSGLAYKQGITLPNTPGTIDSDYRGEIKVIMMNLGCESFTVTRGMRIAQAVLTEVVKAKLILVDTLDATHRGVGGFGHTGTH